MAARRFTILGSGTSTGVPALGCDCSVCRSTDPRNHRNRVSAVVSSAKGNLLIDTPPELRLELLNAKISLIHSVLFTHYHADHLFGLDDIRQFLKYLGHAMPIYCTDDVEASIRQTFAYIFPIEGAPTTSYLPKLEFHRIQPSEVFYVLGDRIQPIELIHAQFRTLGFRFGDVAYCTDVNRIPESSLRHLDALDVLVLDALRYRPHAAHFGLAEALEVIEKLKPKRAYLTHLSHEFDHETVERDLPAHVRLAYDGLTFEF